MNSRESEKNRGPISLLVKVNQSGRLGEGLARLGSCNVQNSTRDLGFCKQLESIECGPELEYSEEEQANLDSYQDVSICTPLHPPSILSFLMYRHRPFNKDGMDK